MSILPNIFTVIEPASIKIFTGNVPVEIVDLYPVLETVTLSVTRNGAGAGTIVLTAGRDETGAWPVIDGGYFERWSPIRIAADFGSYSEDIMWGYVTKITPEFPQERGAAKVTIEMQDQTIALDREERTRDWGDTEDDTTLTDRTVASSILSEYSFRLSPDGADGQTFSADTQDKTDLAHLSGRAEAVGYELRLMMDELYFGPLRLSGAPQKTLLIYAGPDTNCLSFKVDEDASVPDQAIASSVDTSDSGEAKEEVLEPNLPILGTVAAAASASASGVPSNSIRVRQAGDAPPDAARMQTQAKINEASLSITAEAEIDSTIYGHVLLPGKLVSVDGVGRRYGGRYYVDSVEHSFDANGYVQTATLLKNGINEG